MFLVYHGVSIVKSFLSCHFKELNFPWQCFIEDLLLDYVCTKMSACNNYCLSAVIIIAFQLYRTHTFVCMFMTLLSLANIGILGISMVIIAGTRNKYILAPQDNPLKSILQKCEEEHQWKTKGGKDWKVDRNSTRTVEAYAFGVHSWWNWCNV